MLYLEPVVYGNFMKAIFTIFGMLSVDIDAKLWHVLSSHQWLLIGLHASDLVMAGPNYICHIIT